MGKFNTQYIKTLTKSDLVRYKQLIELCGGIDPYEVDLDDCVCDESLIPRVNLFHVMNYLVYSTRSVTMDKMLNYNSSDAYRFLVDGWVKTIYFKKTSNGFILALGRVKHSYRVNEPDNKPWALVKEDGEIICGWCTCKAGCGESCNHLGGILYALEFGNSQKSSTSCTSRACSWLPPHLKDVPFSRIKDIDFETPANKRKRMMGENDDGNNEDDEDDPLNPIPPVVRPCPIQCTPESVSLFFEKLNLVSPASAIFRVLPDYCDNHAPPKVDLPTLDIFKKEYCDLSLSELRREATVFFNNNMKVTLEQHVKIESLTRLQSACQLWFKVKKGRIGGSTVHDVMTTDINNPSLVSVNGVCDPLRPQKKTQWMIAGTKNESKARAEYLQFMTARHFNFSLKQCGAKIPLEYPFLIASTDGEIECDCCGKGILEIKCPKFPNLDEDYVPPDHYDQMQHYLLCLGPNYKYADYLVWHTKDITRKRIFPDAVRQQEILDKTELFSKNCVLPELMGRYFSSLKHVYDTLSISTDTDSGTVICYCQSSRNLPKVKCLGKKCTFKWFHLKCVSLKRVPKQWLCPECKPSSLV